MKFIPFEKLSKKERKKLNVQKRTIWSVNPVTKTTKKKTYKRIKHIEEE